MAQKSWNMEEDGTTCQQPGGPILCVNNCGFFGSPTTMGLCSKCYRDSEHSKVNSVKEPGRFERAEEFQEKLRESSAKPGFAAVEPEVPAQFASKPDLAANPDANQSKPGPSRCSSCRKRVGLTGFKCRCENVFCGMHRHSDLHNCPFDYKTAGRKAIAMANPVVKAEKIEKI